MINYFNRYIEGDCERVWAELYALGDALHQEHIYPQALAVAHETMTRTRQNIEELIRRLSNVGYQFGTYPVGRGKVNGYKRPYTPPPPAIKQRISEYETWEGINSLPLSVRIFWEVVGDVDFMGYYPGLPEYADPLVVYPVEVIQPEYSSWRYMAGEGEVEADQFLIPLAPDYYHKDNVSGGEPYGIRVPNQAVDALFENERLETTFVNYLRTSFRYGGFPGLQWTDASVPTEISALADGLLPI